MNNVQEVLKDAIASAKQARKDQKAYLNKHIEHFISIANGLIVVEKYIINLNIDGCTSLDLSIAGDHHVMNGVWGALRKLGYEASSRPEEKKIASYSCWFTKTDWPRIWFQFSSTKCTRKKIGTKMVEQPIYETVCE